MAKQCIYCGRPLAKDDARFCNDCGRSQVSPASADGGAAAPSAIKVKLPPKEFTRADPSSARPESSLPGRAMGAAPVSPPQPASREQALPPSSRMPKRPARLTPESPAPAKQAEPKDDVFAPRSRPASPVPPAGPTPAEEISTMVLPNWREELAQLRKEQELAGTVAPLVPEKKIERPALEPPPLPRRAPNTPLPPRESGQGGAQMPPPRAQEKPFAEPVSGTRAPQDNARPAELPRRTPQTPLPQNSAAPATLPQRAQSVPLPPTEHTPPASAQRAQSTPLPPTENTRSAEAARRELRVKVWEQEATIHYPQVQAEKQEPGPIAAIEQNPFASVTFGAEDQVMEVEDMQTVNWQAPLSPFPATPSQTPVREEKRPPAGEGSQPGKEEKRPPAREESRPPLREEGNRATVEKSDADIEDLPTARLAVPEVPKPGAQIKVERASTPAPKKWSVPPTDEGEVEDLPTRPMTASPAGPAAPRVPQQPAAPQIPGQGEATVPFTPRTANPPSLPGNYGPASGAQPMGQAAEISADPLASRARPMNPNVQPGQAFNPPSLPGQTANPNSQPGQPFNPPSLPPFPPGPLSSPGNTQLRPETARPQGPQRPATPFPDAPGQRPPQGPADPFGQRPPQRPPSFDASPSTIANVSKPVADVVEGRKPRKKRHTGRLVVVVLLFVVVVGGGLGGWLNREWVAQYFQTPAQIQPFQAYHNSAFGVSLDYTNMWSVSVDQAHNTIRFFDNTHTGQANLIMAAASGQVGDYLNQQATQIPLDGPKPASAVTFANSSWQVLRGTGTQSGATYTIVLYATQHNGHFYLLEFLAPDTAFKNIEQSSFAHMRSSFSFS